jgi:DNA-binding PadR family transcriptional regulator
MATLSPEALVLESLRQNGRQFGQEICKQIQQVDKSEELPCEGSIFWAIRRLARRRLIRIVKVGGNVNTGHGRPPRYYELTPKGRRVAEYTRRAIRKIYDL